MASQTNLIPLDPNTFSSEVYSAADENLLTSFNETNTFDPNTDYVEFFAYNLNNAIVYPLGNDGTFSNYQIIDNEIYINPEMDLIRGGIRTGKINTLYNFYRKRLASSPQSTYYIKEISSNRTEIRLDSNIINKDLIITSTVEFISYRNEDNTFPDFYINLGSNRLYIANNIKLDTDNTVLIKLYEPLPTNIQIKTSLWVVEKLSDGLAYRIEFPNLIEVPNNLPQFQLQGPNYNLNQFNQLNNSSDDVVSTAFTSSNSQSEYQINSYFQDPSVQINIDYSDFSNFVNFSSARSRVENFWYKISLIESASLEITNQSAATTNSYISSSITYLNNLINDTITNFDSYEYYLYFVSSSDTYPKTNSTPPYINESTSSATAVTWYTNKLTTADDYDEFNPNWLKNSIPRYLVDDPNNDQYTTFVNMVGHFVDNDVWVYVKDTTNKWDADNRIDYGVSKDLVAQVLRDMGVNLYQNNYSSGDLYSAFLGFTNSGSLFPYPYMTGSLPTPSGYEYISNFISSSNEAIPLDDINKRIYKRIYHNLPYLLKSKGTVTGLRTLINVYGISDTILRISEFGGKDRINTNDWDLWKHQYNYKFNTGTNGAITTDWELNSDWGSENNRPQTVKFRFQAPDLDSAIANPSQSLWALDTDAFIALEYTGSGYTSGSYSGSIPDPYNHYATLKLVVGGDSASVYLPFFDGNWWSVAATKENDDFNLYAANKIYSGSDGSSLGFQASSSVNTNAGAQEWTNAATSIFPDIKSGYSFFSGSYQEIRYYSVPLSQSVFDDYVMNPQSSEGNGTNGSYTQLAFRASLGGELYTGSVSVHPKVAGSYITSSFTSDSNFTISGDQAEFVTNREWVFYDSPPVGLRNRNTDKIKQQDLILPSGDTLSALRTIQQTSYTTQDYTNNLNLLEVAFSPQNQINDDIIGQIGYFNIGDYIGDPRLVSSSANTYPSLVELSQQYFDKYSSNYDVYDYIRLIKFFDNSLFKMVKDYVPARTGLASGIVVKQHLLERQKYPVPQASWTQPEYTGSIGEIAGLLDGQRIYTSSAPYESFPIESITGSQGGTLPDLIINYGTNFGYTTTNIVNVSQSWDGNNLTPYGYLSFTDNTAQEFVNGEFSGSTIITTNGELNPECDPFKVANTTIIQYSASSYTTVGSAVNYRPFVYNSSAQSTGTLNAGVPSVGNTQQIPLSESLAFTNYDSGDIRIYWESTRTVSYNNSIYAAYPNSIYDEFTPKAIRISKTSVNGLDLTNYIPSVIELTLPSYTATIGYTTVSLSPAPGEGYQTISCQNVGGTGLKLFVTSISERTDSYYLLVTYSSGFKPRLTTEFNYALGSVITYPIVIKDDYKTEVLFSPYVPSTFNNSDCNAIYGNEVAARLSTKFYDLDYSSNAIQAVNQQTVISASQEGGFAVHAPVQDYNWYTKRSTLPRYIGSRNSDEEGINDPGYYYGSINSNIDNPFYPAQDRSSLILEFNGGGGSYPEIEKGGGVFMTQLINANSATDVTYIRQKDEGYTDVVNYNYRGYDFENFVIVNQYEGSNATVPPASSQIILTNASVPPISNYIIPATAVGPGTGSITFNTTSKYITWKNESAVNSAIYTVTTNTNGYECTGSQVSTNDFLNALYSGSVSGSEYYISLYQSLEDTAQGTLNQVLNWPLKITGINVPSGITYLHAGIKNSDFISYSINADKVGGNSSVGGYGSGISYGALVWAADKTKRAIIVQQPTGSFSNIQKGALTKPNNTTFIQQNTEYLTRTFGSDPTPNIPIIQSTQQPQSAPSSNNVIGGGSLGGGGTSS